MGVVWEDAVGSIGGKNLTPMPAITFGFLIADEPGFVRVAGEILADGDHRNETVIPRGMVRGLLHRALKLPLEFKGWHARGADDDEG